jgi:hypothetical protein
MKIKLYEVIFSFLEEKKKRIFTVIGAGAVVFNLIIFSN